MTLLGWKLTPPTTPLLMPPPENCIIKPTRNYFSPPFLTSSQRSPHQMSEFSEMGSSDRLFNRQRTVHEILGAGLVADVMLWRRKNLTVGILLVTLAVWVVFERSGYTLLSLASSVLLLLATILFLWAKSASILNRPAPPIPELHLSEELVNEVADIVRARTNAFLSVSHDIALGKNSEMFFRAASYLLLIAVVGSFTDLLTLCYTSLVIVLTVPALYERFEDHIDGYVISGCREVQEWYGKLNEVGYGRWILEKKKLS